MGKKAITHGMDRSTQRASSRPVDMTKGGAIIREARCTPASTSGASAEQGEAL